MSGKIVWLNKSLYDELKQASRMWHAHLITCLKSLGFEQCEADVCVFRLIEDRRVAITAVVHVDAASPFIFDPEVLIKTKLSARDGRNIGSIIHSCTLLTH